MVYSALEQFDIFKLVCCGIFFWPVNLNVTHLFCIFVLFSALFFVLTDVYTSYWRPWCQSLLPSMYYYSAAPWSELVLSWLWIDSSLLTALLYRSNQAFSFLYNVFFALYQLVVNILKVNILQRKNSNVGFLFFLFLNLLFFNVLGLLPYTFTVTSSFVVTLFFALTVFLAANIMGIFYNGSSLIFNFLPTGTPLFIAPLLILIEIISYFSRIFSLSIRLFANMLSGHGLLKILIGFSFIALKSVTIWSVVSLLPWIVVTIVFALEIAIAFLQAYVFIILTSIYINDAINPH